VCTLCVRFRAGGNLWPGKQGNSFHRDRAPGWVRVSLDRELELKLGNIQQEHSGLYREAQMYLNAKLQERGIGDPPRAAAIRLDLTWTSGWQRQKSRGCGPKRYSDYEALLRLHIRPALGTKPVGAITLFPSATRD
jgi:hypothetical protein